MDKNVVQQTLIADQWDDVLRLVGSLTVPSFKDPEVLRVLARGGSLCGLGKAVAEGDKVAKTLYLLRYIVDPDYRRRIQIQLNRGEGGRRPALTPQVSAHQCAAWPYGVPFRPRR